MTSFHSRKDAKTQINLAKNVLPWLTIGGGAIVFVLGAFLALRKGQPMGKLESKAAGAT